MVSLGSLRVPGASPGGPGKPQVPSLVSLGVSRNPPKVLRPSWIFGDPPGVLFGHRGPFCGLVGTCVPASKRSNMFKTITNHKHDVNSVSTLVF